MLTSDSKPSKKSQTLSKKSSLSPKPQPESKHDSITPQANPIETARLLEALSYHPEPNQALLPFPEPSGPARAVLMLVHPQCLHLYWVLDSAAQGIVGSATGSARLCVEISDGLCDFYEVSQEDFDFRVKSWYLKSTYVDCLVRVRLCINTHRGLETVLVSNPVRIPREAPGKEPEAWMDLSEIRRKRLERASLRPVKANPEGQQSALGYMATPEHWYQQQVKWLARDSRVQVRDEHYQAKGFINFVLHSHLPFNRHPDYDYFLEEHWLFEAISETYIPILDMLENLRRDEVPVRITVSLSPTLMSMLRDPHLVDKYEKHLHKMCDLAQKELNRTRHDPQFEPVTRFYYERITRYRDLFTRQYKRDLVGEFVRLEEAGMVELMTCAGTHGFLPLLNVHPESVWAQIHTAVTEFERQVGKRPRGIWLPECAYVDGLDDLLAKAGLDYFFVDTHAIKNASSQPRLGVHAPVFCPSGVAAFCRDIESSVQVWSAELGYPGDPAYRDFYRDIGFDLDASYVGPYLDPSGVRGMTGFKYYRVTGRSNHKEPYRRDWAQGAIQAHADDFVLNRTRQVSWLSQHMSRTPLVVSMYDAELFGHWWFEGPEWLEGVLRRLGSKGLAAISPSQYLQIYPVGQIAEPAASSWGEKGYFEVWVNDSNDWIYPALHDASRRMIDLARRFGHPNLLQERVLKQAGRELLLAQSSDWPFILRTGTSTGYARRRIHEHLHHFDRLARQLEQGSVDEIYLGRLEYHDNLFPEIEPRVWRSE